MAVGCFSAGNVICQPAFSTFGAGHGRPDEGEAPPMPTSLPENKMAMIGMLNHWFIDLFFFIHGMQRDAIRRRCRDARGLSRATFIISRWTRTLIVPFFER